MSTDALARRVGRLKGRPRQGKATTGNDWVQAAYEVDREKRATLALVAFAQALAGTVKVEAPLSPVCDGAMEAEPPAPAPPPRGAARVWSQTVRPGPHDVLTWDEAMRVPWLQES